MSRPARARGLKPDQNTRAVLGNMSRAPRWRVIGLKLRGTGADSEQLHVAPRAPWIETTSILMAICGAVSRAQRAALWIEATNLRCPAINPSVAPQRRGLKLFLFCCFWAGTKSRPALAAWIETAFCGSYDPFDSVAPRAGAWIETPMYTLLAPPSRSRAPRGRVD